MSVPDDKYAVVPVPGVVIHAVDHRSIFLPARSVVMVEAKIAYRTIVLKKRFIIRFDLCDLKNKVWENMVSGISKRGA